MIHSQDDVQFEEDYSLQSQSKKGISWKKVIGALLLIGLIGFALFYQSMSNVNGVIMNENGNGRQLEMMEKWRQAKRYAKSTAVGCCLEGQEERVDLLPNELQSPAEECVLRVEEAIQETGDYADMEGGRTYDWQIRFVSTMANWDIQEFNQLTGGEFIDQFGDYAGNILISLKYEVVKFKGGKIGATRTEITFKSSTKKIMKLDRSWKEFDHDKVTHWMNNMMREWRRNKDCVLLHK